MFLYTERARKASVLSVTRQGEQVEVRTIIAIIQFRTKESNVKSRFGLIWCSSSRRGDTYRKIRVEEEKSRGRRKERVRDGRRNTMRKVKGR